MRDRIGRAIAHISAGRAFALLWLFAAVLSMPFNASAERLAARTGTAIPAGDFSAPDAAFARHALRATPAADLRFVSERSDAKPLPGGPGPVFLPLPAPFVSTLNARQPCALLPDCRLPVRVEEAAQARAPPPPPPGSMRL